MIENDVSTCPYCKKSVVFTCDADTGAVISSPDYVLIANWIYHRECWDKQVAESPP